MPNDQGGDRGASDGRSLRDFLHDELVGAVLLAIAAAAALAWANVHEASYLDVWDWVPVPDAPGHFDLDLKHWVNDGFMTVFFFVVGLEIKRELTIGELSRPRDALIPLVAAAGGMAVPAAIYAMINAGGTDSQAWGVPVATDIAFVLGVLALVARGAPPALRLFLLAVAIIDDIGGILVIAVFYGETIDLLALGVAALGLASVRALRAVGEVRPLAYAPSAVATWAGLHESGIHATLAGVMLGLMTPTATRAGRSLLDDLQHRLHPFSAAVVVPLFALANAGVVLRGDTIADAATSRPALGIFTGLVVGKTIGISVATLLAVRSGLGALPAQLTPVHVVGGAALAGIGFTVSLFIADLSLEGDTLAEAKIAVLAAAFVATALGAAVLRRTPRTSAAGPQRG